MAVGQSILMLYVLVSSLASQLPKGLHAVCKTLVGWQAAFASRLCSYEKRDQKIAACGSSYLKLAAQPHHSTMSASSSTAFDLDPRATSEG
jgi:hypothetical protein